MQCPLLAQRGHPFALRMSAFGGKADITFCREYAFAVAIGSKADIACCAAYVR